MSTNRDRLLLFWRRRPGDRPPLVRIDLRTVAFFGVMLVLIGLAGWLYLRQATEVSSYERDIRRLEQRRDRLRREIVALRAETGILGSLDRVQAAGAEWGYRLPSATDSQRRIRLEYAPIELPSGEPEQMLADATPAADVEEDKGVLQHLREQFESWLSSPMAESR